MEYYYTNTEAKNLATKRSAIWLEEKGAFVSGTEYGEKLGRLNRGDICFMYESGSGVVAIGTVTKAWDGQISYPPVVYATDQGPEYRINVDWFLPFPENPITPPMLREIIGWISPQAIQRIANRANAEQLIAYARNR